jgi:predicted O-methyltransferase YrrM|tara:strand:- start:343 stop:897 length:555 start_codon:yes stop_codon:yes gene_type:complete
LRNPPSFSQKAKLAKDIIGEDYWNKRKSADFRDKEDMGMGDDEIETLIKWSQLAGQMCPQCDQLEIGVLWGASSSTVACALQKSFPQVTTLQSIDPDAGGEAKEAATRQNFEATGVSKTIDYYVDFPVAVHLKKPISFMFMDGEHNSNANEQYWDYTMSSTGITPYMEPTTFISNIFLLMERML